jgi:hypothetical protein
VAGEAWPLTAEFENVAKNGEFKSDEVNTSSVVAVAAR